MEEGVEAEKGGRGVAPGPGDPVRPLQGLPVELGHGVDEAAKEVWPRVLPVVPAVKLRVLQAEVRGEVHEDGGQGAVAVKLPGEDPVGQGQDQDVRGLQLLRGDELEVRASSEVGVDEVDGLAREAPRGHLLHFQIGVGKGEPQELSPGVPRGPHDGKGFLTGHGATS